MENSPFIFSSQYTIYENKYSDGSTRFQAHHSNVGIGKNSLVGGPKETYVEALHEVQKHNKQVRLLQTIVHKVEPIDAEQG